MPILETGTHKMIFLLALLLTSVSAIWDVLTGRIPNVITLPALFLGLFFQFIQGGPQGLASGALGAVAGGAVPFVLFRLSKGRGIGGGDIKLFAALGAFLGAGLVLEVQFVSFVCMSLLALGRLAYRGAMWRVLLNTAMLAVNPLLPQNKRNRISPEALTPMRMGPAIFAALLCFAPTQWS